MFQSPVAPSADFAVDGAEAYGFPPFKGGKITALLQNSVEKYLDRRRRERSEPGATSPRRMVMRHGGGRGAEVMFRGAEPLCGCAAQGRKRAGRGYMLPLARVEHGLTLWQRMLPLKPEQGRTPRTTPSTRFYNRAKITELYHTSLTSTIRYRAGRPQFLFYSIIPICYTDAVFGTFHALSVSTRKAETPPRKQGGLSRVRMF